MSTGMDKIGISDLEGMCLNIRYKYANKTNSLSEKVRKVVAITVGVFFIIGAFFAHPFNNSNNISINYNKLFPLVITQKEPPVPTAPPAEEPSGLYPDLYCTPPTDVATMDSPPAVAPQNANEEFVKGCLQKIDKSSRKKFQEFVPEPILPLHPDPEIFDTTRLSLAKKQAAIINFLDCRPEPAPKGTKIFRPEGSNRATIRTSVSLEYRQAKRKELEDRYVETHQKTVLAGLKYANKKAVRRAIRAAEEDLRHSNPIQQIGPKGSMRTSPVSEVFPVQGPRPDVVIETGLTYEYLTTINEPKSATSTLSRVKSLFA